jgi:inner membrane protein
MAEIVRTLGPWGWVVLGLVLMGLELVAPGVFLVWLGLAAVLTGLLDAGLGLSWQAAWLTFSGLAVVAVAGGRMLTRSRDEGAARR